MIQMNHVTLTHKKDLRVILDDFNLVLHAGDKAAIIGEEGNGKSTLLKWFFEPNLVDSYMEAKGTRILANEILAYLPQELSDSDREKTLYEFFSDRDAFWNQSQKELASLAKQFGVTAEFFYSEQRMQTLSGGEKIKAQLMRILMDQPTVLLLDEPSNDIDILTLQLLERLIQEWKGIVLFISHDETLLEQTANLIIHIEQIRRKTQSRYTVARRPYTKYLEERLHSFERQEQQALSDRREKKLRDEKYRRVLQGVEHALNTVSRQSPSEAKNLKDKMHTVKAMGRRFSKEDENMTDMPEEESAIYFKLGNAKTEIPAGKTVLDYKLDQLCVPNQEKVLADHLIFRVRGPEKICIRGANGVGKTTFLKKIAEELLPQTDIRAEYMPQNYEEILDLDMTPVDYLNQSEDMEERTRIRTYLGSLKYTTDEMEHPIRELSGGQKAKVLLLKMSLADTNVLILDEPTRNFSPLSGPVIRKMLREFPGAIISVSHDRKYMKEVCDVHYELTREGLIRISE